MGDRPSHHTKTKGRPVKLRLTREEEFYTNFVRQGLVINLKVGCDAEGNLLSEMLQLTRDLIPPQFTLHALGVGHPANVVACARMGYNIFDSTMPTRDARHGRLMIFTTDPRTSHLDEAGKFFRYIYIKDKKHVKTQQPLSEFCDCLACNRYSLGYLHHLYNLNDVLYQRLATLHNLRFMTRLMENLRRENTKS